MHNWLAGTAQEGFSFPMLIRIALLFLIVGSSFSAGAAARNVILVTLDGARTQEIFRGLDVPTWQEQNKDQKAEETDLHRKFWASTPEARRERLLPFFWGTLMKNHGAIVGDRFNGSVMKLSNRHRFSYPGYSEILTGRANDREIDSNSKIYNPRTTVLEWLKGELRLGPNQVAAFACWDVMDYIVMKEPGAIASNAGFEEYASADPAVAALSRLQFATPTPWNSVRHDVYTFRFAMDHLKTHRPRVLYLSLGETDDWAHDKRYDRVIEALHRSDGYFRELWEWLQAQDDYRDQTTVLFATDHGRGDDPLNWQHHNDKLDGAAFVWLAAAGKGVTKRGNLTPSAEYSQDQISGTLLHALGIDASRYSPEAGKPVELFFK